MLYIKLWKKRGSHNRWLYEVITGLTRCDLLYARKYVCWDYYLKMLNIDNEIRWEEYMGNWQEPDPYGRNFYYGYFCDTFGLRKYLEIDK